jgi:hypothetical protein
MRKKIFIAVLILVVLITATGIIWRTFDFSSDYNYATAKLDIKNGEVKLIHTGVHKPSAKDPEIEKLAARYGFTNIYVEKFTEKETAKGIKHYNDLVETYLILRNGPGWKTLYEKEVDSLYKAAFNH